MDQPTPFAPAELLLHDEHDSALLRNVHPPDWANPRPQGRYDLVVVGAGTAGLVTASAAAGLGAKVALIEKHLMGGDCLNVGCVPSKALLRAARMCAAVRRSSVFGVELPSPVQVNFAFLMQRMRQLRASLSPHDSASRYRGLGVDVYFGEARFASPETVDVAGQHLSFRRAVIATGARPAIPAIPGLADVGYLTNETVFALTELPRRLAVLGGGPIGCELAQAFARFGSEVTLLETQPRLLSHEETEATEIVQAALLEDGVRIHCGSQLLSVQPHAEGKELKWSEAGHAASAIVDRILVGVGRAPQLQGLGLEDAGVAYDGTGIRVDRRLATTNSRIFAAGDVCSRYRYTHAADAMARIVVQNALFFGRARADRLVIPRCIYTEPEVAQVGLTVREAEQQKVPVDRWTQPLDRVDRAVLDGQSSGFVRVLTRQGTDKIVGATIVADHAGDLISEITLAMVSNRGLRTLSRTIHPYPTQAEAIKKPGDAYQRQRLTPWLQRGLAKWFAWLR